MSTTVESLPAVESFAGNEDLITEALSNLPVRPLLRFKSVSKQWLNLISDRRFSHLHSRRHRNPRCSALLFFHHSLSSPISLPSFFDFIPLRANGNRSSRPRFFSDLESSNLTILQSCNGLLLLGSLVPEIDEFEFAYFVCNPTINQIFQLPVPDEIAHGNRSILGVNLAFDPEKWDGGYKIIFVWKSNSDEIQHGIDAFLPETGQWRRIIDCCSESLPFDLEFERGIYCDGKIHWLSHTECSAFFDLQSGTIRPLPMPPPLEGVYIERFRHLGESLGHLHLVEIRTNSASEFDVLELENQTLIWSVKYRVNLDVVGHQFDEMFQNYNDRFGRRFRFYSFSILAVVRAEREEDTTLVLSIPGKVISYNFETGFTDLLCEVADQTDKWLPFKGYNAYQFLESLYWCI